MTKVQLVKTPKNLTLVEIMAHFSTEDKAREYLEAVRWPRGPICPHCGGMDKVYPIQANPEAEVRAGLYECGDCHGQFTVTVGTIFEKSKVPLHKWLVAWYLLCSSKKGFSAAQLQRALELGSYRTAWFMLHRVRYALADPVFTTKLGGDKGNGAGIVEADETYIGGKVKGKGRAYKGNKTAVVTLVERGGEARSRAMVTVTGENLAAVLAGCDPKARFMTDENPSYLKPGQRFRSHETVVHSREEYVRGDVHTNTAEGFFANLKRGITGIYHHVGSQYLQQYLGEFDFRYNTRNASDGVRTIAGLRKAEGKRLMLRRPKEGGMAESNV